MGHFINPHTWEMECKTPKSRYTFEGHELVYILLQACYNTEASLFSPRQAVGRRLPLDPLFARVGRRLTDGKGLERRGTTMQG